MNQKMIHFIILFHLIFLSKSNNCDGCTRSNDMCISTIVEGTCDQNCKPNLLNDEDTICYYCNDDDDDITNNKYYIINSQECIWKQSCNGLIIQGSDQCVVGSCGNLYQLGDYCYNINSLNQEIVSCDLNKICRCKYKYHIVENDGIKMHHCYGETDSCDPSYNYYYLEEHLCSNTDCPDNLKKKSLTDGKFRCSNECTSREYLITRVVDGQNKEYCIDECLQKIFKDYPNNKCIENCNSIHLYEKSDECVVESQCNFIDGSKCMESCSGENKYHKINDKNCILHCDPENEYELDFICYSECPSHFIKPDEKKCYSITEAASCFYIEEEEKINNNRKCYKTCPSGHYYHNKDSKICITSCNISNNDYKFHKQEDSVCYPSCLEIPDNSGVLGKYIYENDGVCSDTPCQYYSSNSENGVKKCYQNESKCKEVGYQFLNGNECVYNCQNFKFVSTNDISLGICFNSLEDCKDKGYFYYNSQEKLCWNEGCGSGYKTNEIDTSTSKPKEDNLHNTCTKNCFYPYPKLSSDGKFCKSDCDTNEFYTTNEPNKCKPNLGDCEGFITENKECVSNCPSFYYIDNGIKKCTNDCNAVLQYYYENEKECRDNCEIFSNDNTRCLRQCSQNEKVYDKHCFSNCPSSAPYYIETTINSVNVNKCVLNCNVENPAYTKIIAYINKCEQSCPQQYYDINDFCYPNCPEGKKYFNPITLTCEDKCPSDLPVCEKLGRSDTCICKLNCDGTKQYIIKGECVNSCSEKYNKIGKNNECKENCSSEDDGEFYIDTEGTTPYKIYKCCNCPSGDANYFKDKECYKICPTNFKYVINDQHECLSECPDNNPYYDKNTPDSNGHFICSNNFHCNTDKYYLDGECVNENICINKNKRYIENKICVLNCKEAFKYKKINEQNVYECKESCGGLEFILDNKECVDKCPDGKNFIGKDNNCKIACEEEDGLNYYLVSDETSYKIYKCVDRCSGVFYLSARENKECFKQCSDAGIYKYLSSSENICFDNCLFSQYNQFTLEDKCVLKCNDPNNKYYYEGDKICKGSCNPGHYAIQNINQCVPDCSSIPDITYYSYTKLEVDDTYYEVDTCVTQCPESKPFADGTTCVNICPETSRYYIKEFKHGEIDLQKKCLNDCPQEYPFYTIIEDSSTQKKYPCQNDCTEGYYVPNFSDQNIIAKLCLSTCDGTSLYEDYKYKIIDETNNNKTCYNVCPPEKPYHKEVEGSDCLAICPDDAPVHEIGSTICITEDRCSGSYIDYETRQCLNTDVTDCPGSRRYKSKKNSKYICLDTCIQSYGEYLSPYNTCEHDCSSSVSEFVSGKHLKNDIEKMKCICENLFYIDNSLQLVCLVNTIDNCKNEDVPSEYKIRMHGSNECIQTCLNRGILSPSEDICYEETYECSQIDINSYLITKENGQKKCDCLYKYYFNEENQKICLNEKSQCPSGYDKYIPSIKECLKAGVNCPTKYKFTFKNFCLENPPLDSKVTDNNCECKDDEDNEIFWYEVSNGDFKCLPQCLDTHPVYIPDTKQCLEKCTETFYPNLFENKCYSSCDSNDNLNIIGGTVIERVSTLSKYICGCPEKWYFDDESQKTICVSDCFSGDPIFKYLVRKTSQCLNECPQDYPYYFNNECYSSCENEAKQLFHLNLKTVVPLLECQCENLWYFTDDEETTKECLVEDKCTLSNTENLYLKEGSKQCIKTCPTVMYKFNFICYYKCPANTLDHIDNIEGNFCTCNLNEGFWYEYQDNGNTFYVCGLSECPKYNNNNDINIIRNNLIETEKKCVKSCLTDGEPDNEFKYALRNICIKECPSLSKTIVDECIFYNLDDSSLDDLEKLKNAVNVQSKELYENSNNLGGFLFNKFDTSLQIYAIDKSNSLKEVSLKSNLTYIDFGTCLGKIFSDSSLGNNDKILVSKYDLLTKENTQNNNKNKYLINKVEYELYSSKMNEKIDASVCNPYEIIISYPLSLDKYDNYINGINKNEYKKLFDIGKELYLKNDKLDTFNFNNTLYKDICTGIEIDGKDLVLEDRYKYLYPNDVFFCEHNCTLNNTDFELERVNCLCNYKEKIDFERQDEDTEIRVYSSSQSSANVEILKCLGKLTVKQSIINNEAFYYCAVITMVEISLSLFSFLTSIKTVSSNISSLLSKISMKSTMTNSNNLKKNVKFKSENITTTNRALNNPPKKRINDNGGEEDVVEKQSNKDKFTFNENDIKNNNDDDVIFKEKNIVKKEVVQNYDSNNEIKAEFIPPEFNFKFFKLNDKGVIKKIERNKLPFKIEPETKYLIEAKEGVNYDEDYLNGPFYSDQNILVVVDSNSDINYKDIIQNMAKDNLDKANIKSNTNNITNNSISVSYIQNNKEDIKSEHKSPIKKRNNNITNKDFRNTNGEKSFITIKKLSLYKPQKSEKINIDDYKEDNNDNKKSNNIKEKNNEDEELGLLTSIKREQIALRITYNKYTERNHPSLLIIFLAEILDKIYFVKICAFLKKYESFSIHASLYLFCHLILLTLHCAFFTVGVIRKIWERSDFPDMSFYLLYGFICNVIVWIIYQIFLCILDMEDGVKELLKTKTNSKNNGNNDEEIIEEINEDLENEKFSKLMSQMKIKMIIFYLLLFLFTIFCSIYLISFFSIYTGTKSLVFESYYISIIEIVLIKFVYGVILASLRIVSTVNEFKFLYKIVYIFDKFIS